MAVPPFNPNVPIGRTEDGKLIYPSPAFLRWMEQLARAADA